MINAFYDMPGDVAAELLMQRNATRGIMYGNPSGSVLTRRVEEGAIDAYHREFESTHDESKAQKAYFDHFKKHQS